MILIAVLSFVLVAFLFWSKYVEMKDGFLYVLAIGSLLFYFSIPAIAKRPNYIGDVPKIQRGRINTIPFKIFVVICLLLSSIGWIFDV